MPLIKTVTAEGGVVRVVTKEGKPSCTCCDGCTQCDPSTIQIYAEWYYDDGVDPPQGPNYYDAIIDLTATGPDCTVEIVLDFGATLIDLVYGVDGDNWSIYTTTGTSSSRCDPSSVYFLGDGATTVTISTTPLP